MTQKPRRIARRGLLCGGGVGDWIVGPGLDPGLFGFCVAAGVPDGRGEERGGADDVAGGFGVDDSGGEECCGDEHRAEEEGKPDTQGGDRLGEDGEYAAG